MPLLSIHVVDTTKAVPAGYHAHLGAHGFTDQAALGSSVLLVLSTAAAYATPREEKKDRIRRGRRGREEARRPELVQCAPIQIYMTVDPQTRHKLFVAQLLHARVTSSNGVNL